MLNFHEPQTEHFMCLPTAGTGVSAGSGAVAGLTSRSWPQSPTEPQQFVIAREVAEGDEVTSAHSKRSSELCEEPNHRGV